ncbi:MAG: flagella basal body P-ring formation protein FlgA [Acidobacteriaceae bacterium]
MMLRRTILGVLVTLISGCALGQSTCTARTPERALPPGWAVQASSHTSAPESRERSSRYRLARVVVDPELHRRWAFIANCTHPEWPLQVVAIASESTPLGTPATATEAPSAVPAAPSPAEPRPRQAAVPRPAVLTQSSAQPQAVRNSTKPPAPISSTVVPLVRAGDLVHLWSSDASVQMEIEVVSLEYGRAGQVIRLRRLGQSALLAGVVVGKDSAELVP